MTATIPTVTGSEDSNGLPHGRRRYNKYKCRCGTCRGEASAYRRWRSRQHAYGRPPKVDAGPVRAHVVQLRAAGMTVAAVSRASGVTVRTLTDLLRGNPSKRSGPSVKVYASTARKLLAVALVLDTPTVDGRPARRRLQALVANGHTISRLARLLGMLPCNLNRLIREERPMLLATDQAIRDLYERLWNQPPPTTTRHERVAASKARGMAARKRWPVPMEWDDDRIDDPTPTEQERVDVVRRLVAEGAGVTRIAREIHADRRTVYRLLEAS